MLGKLRARGVGRCGTKDPADPTPSQGSVWLRANEVFTIPGLPVLLCFLGASGL